MLKPVRKIRDLLFGDDLIVRVVIFITGALIAAIVIPVSAIISLGKDYDSALYILLAILTVFALFLLYASIFGSPRLVDKAANWANSGSIIFFIVQLALAIPITLLIRHYKNGHNRNDT